jgi:hypothetical protein
MNILVSVLITFLVIILILYLVNLLPLDGRAKHIVRVIVIVIGIISMLKIPRRLLTTLSGRRLPPGLPNDVPFRTHALYRTLYL